MARIQWTDIGTGIQVFTDLNTVTETIDATNPALVISLAALNGGGLDQPASMNEVEKVLLAIVRKVQNHTTAEANRDDSLLEIDEPRFGSTQRDSANFRTMDYAMTFYKPDSITTAFDPDKLDVSEA